MLSALIVDDEYASTEILKDIIDWRSAGFSEPVCVNSGKKALNAALSNDFDVIITDVEMPGMSGLELIAVIKEKKPGQRFIIASCHESFDYARTAIKLGVQDYFVKDLLTPEELYQSLLNVTSKGEGEPLPAASHSERESAVFAVTVVVDSYGKSKAAYGHYQWLSVLNGFFSELRANGVSVVNAAEGQFFIVERVEKHFSALYNINTTVNFASRIRRLAANVGITSVSIGISDVVDSGVPEHTLFEQAEKSCGMRVLMGLNKTFVYSAVSDKSTRFEHSELEQKIRKIKLLLDNKDSGCLTVIDSLYRVSLMDGFMEANYFKYINNRLFIVAQSYVDRLDESSVQKLTQNNFLSFYNVESLETVNEMRQYFNKIYNLLLTHEEGGQQQHGSLIERSLRYIESNYDKNISLSDIAEEMGVHKGYLSRVFKEKTGENIMHAIATKKVDKAKKLLVSSEMKIDDIAKSLGFTTAQYFCMVFKKHAEMSPQEYKRLAVGKGGGRPREGDY